MFTWARTMGLSPFPTVDFVGTVRGLRASDGEPGASAFRRRPKIAVIQTVAQRRADLFAGDVGSGESDGGHDGSPSLFLRMRVFFFFLLAFCRLSTTRARLEPPPTIVRLMGRLERPGKTVVLVVSARATMIRACASKMTPIPPVTTAGITAGLRRGDPFGDPRVTAMREPQNHQQQGLDGPPPRSGRPARAPRSRCLP